MTNNTSSSTSQLLGQSDPASIMKNMSPHARSIYPLSTLTRTNVATSSSRITLTTKSEKNIMASSGSVKVCESESKQILETIERLEKKTAILMELILVKFKGPGVNTTQNR